MRRAVSVPGKFVKFFTLPPNKRPRLLTTITVPGYKSNMDDRERQMQITKIERLTYAFEAYGYFVDAQPIAGQEADFANHLAQGLAKVEAAFKFNAEHHGFRGRSKRAIDSLHRSLPEPVWGVGVR